MLKIHTDDGKTSRVDFEDEGQAKAWLERLKDPRFQDRITALTIAVKGVQYSLPKPAGFDQIFLHAEPVTPDPSRKIKGGERIVCFAGDTRVTIMVHKEQRAARVSLARVGKQRFNPLAR